MLPEEPAALSSKTNAISSNPECKKKEKGKEIEKKKRAHFSMKPMWGLNKNNVLIPLKPGARINVQSFIFMP